VFNLKIFFTFFLTVNIQFLNSLQSTVNEDLKEFALYCIINAPNAFDLLQLLFVSCVDQSASDQVKREGECLAELVLKQLHEKVYSSPFDGQLTFAIVLKNHLTPLVSLFVETKQKNENLSQLLLRILNLLCVHFGREFCIQTVHELLDQLNAHFDETIDVSDSEICLIADFLHSLRLPFGSDVFNCVRDACQLDQTKQPRFWANVFTLIQSDECFEMDLSLAVEKFTALVQEQDNYFSIHHSLKIVEICLQNREKVCRPQHHLCIALVANYTRIIEEIEEEEDMLVKLSIVVLSQDCIKLLGLAHESNQHIICRALIESELKTTSAKPYVKTDEFDETRVNLLQENLDYGTSFNVKKMPLSASLRDSVRSKKRKLHVPIENKQFVFDAIRYCVGDNYSLLADLLVEIVTPDVMFNERTWPEDEFLKVIKLF
jgi:hypothetical protein